MIEWGPVQTKIEGAKLMIEESGTRDKAKGMMPTVWVRFTGLPEELREFLVIWAVGSILGVTKDVDMKFTKERDTARMKVMVLDPELIPESVDVVIGQYIYELHFQVEQIGGQDDPMPMELEGDDENGDRHHGNDTSNGSDGQSKDAVNEDKGKQKTAESRTRARCSREVPVELSKSP